MSFLLASLKSPANNENPPATTERAPETLASAEKKPRSGIRQYVSHTTESSPPDDSRPNFQAVLDESMLTDQNGEVETPGAWEVDSAVTIELHETLIPPS
ncbi:hypothetical protein ASPFODRAFT_54269 [Aspergillus luchuensis CBS 106.47]|uniref:Uncharacterized protein n=1 Tax=Aspergillus luchuensis (strain CBS 106.47) TaxID=1137211 RepID=A0A1M3SZN8_ASPLC|nr:hypothetical protein ASPFODRAFT_54269 [Aspergillus luchuensis CBS 106.47]